MADTRLAAAQFDRMRVLPLIRVVPLVIGVCGLCHDCGSAFVQIRGFPRLRNGLADPGSAAANVAMWS